MDIQQPRVAHPIMPSANVAQLSPSSGGRAAMTGESCGGCGGGGGGGVGGCRGTIIKTLSDPQ